MVTDRDLQSINERLAAFERDTPAFMNRQPEKEVIEGFTGDSVTPLVGMRTDNAFVSAHDSLRQQTLAQGSRISARAVAGAADNPASLVDNLRYNKLAEMAEKGLLQASLSETPWSDDYWGFYKGVLGARYADPDFPEADDWKKNQDYVLANPVRTILASNSATRINQLSPAEKYDALMGDDSFSLTAAMWQEGKRYYDSQGSVESWMGICHGWAPAAYMLDRPVRPVTLVTPANVPIKFFPADIKALASLLWANAAPRTRFIGGRCNDKEPEVDQPTGRVISERCFDTNPGSWHVAVVNQVGVAQRSMVLDVTFDYEVWNQPVYAYEYVYFNPQTRKATRSLAEATVKLADFSNDRFSRFRSTTTRSVVGISMKVQYVVETYPRQREEDSPAYDALHAVTYEYDLELDENDVIIGGEWDLNKHPDFL
ncbi:MAG TPA: hypothetical protein PLN94_14415, partial [Thiolinea sp.]|nr:hypothetical protein [Thiolinea sp.]